MKLPHENVFVRIILVERGGNKIYGLKWGWGLKTHMLDERGNGGGVMISGKNQVHPIFFIRTP